MDAAANAVYRVLDRELETLRAHLRAYADETQIWAPAPGIPNSAGTLVLHLCENLQHFVGAALGGTGYVRDREREFSARGLSRGELEAQIDLHRCQMTGKSTAIDEPPIAMLGESTGP